MKKVSKWLDKFLEGNIAASRDDKLKRKYLKVLRIMLIVLFLEFGIGKINGGEHRDYLEMQTQVAALDNEQLKAKVTDKENLENGATRIIFELESSDYDYQKKVVRAFMGNQKLQGGFLNNRFYWVQTPALKESSTIKVSLLNLTGEEEASFMDYEFNLKVETSERHAFSKLSSLTFDLRLLDADISQTQKKIQSVQKEIENKKQKMKEAQAEIKSLESQGRDLKVKTEKENIAAQITTYQESITNLAVDISNLQTQVETSQIHLQQLQEEKDKKQHEQ